MKITGDQSLIKKINKGLVLDTIIASAPLSRADISAKTGLNKATVSSLVNEWIDGNMVIETGLGESSGGRKPVMLLYNNRAGFAVGVDLGVNYIVALLTDLAGAVIHREKLDLHTSYPASVEQQLREIIRSVIAAAPESPYGIVGIGIGVPGIVDESGVILTAPNLNWKGVSLQEKLQSEFQAPITIDNEANAGAIGEQKYGVGKAVDNLIYISAGIGIGSGIIMNGRIYRGAAGLSGELGHMTIQANNGLPCSCGNFGCWEMYASENALLHGALTSGAFGKDPSIDTLMEAAEREEALALELFEEIGHYLGTGIANVINAFNPEMVIVGNRLGLAKRWIETSMQRSAMNRSLRYHSKGVRIEFAALGMDSTAAGAATEAVANFLASVK
jgi:glucokinase-like ROK family protein